MNREELIERIKAVRDDGYLSATYLGNEHVGDLMRDILDAFEQAHTPAETHAYRGNRSQDTCWVMVDGEMCRKPIEAHTPTDDERETLLLEKVKTAGHVMSETMRFADFDYPVKAIPYSRFLEMLAGFRRPVQGEPTDAQVTAAKEALGHSGSGVTSLMMRCALRAAAATQ